MVTIRLSRVGKKKQPSYRLVVSEKSKDPWGKYIENLGIFNPLAKPAATFDFKVDRIKYWLSQGAQPSDTVWNILVDQKIVEGEKRRTVSITKRRQDKLAKKQAS
jgi:small subunit ribosomal protein S16